jgi:hypothetical protein
LIYYILKTRDFKDYGPFDSHSEATGYGDAFVLANEDNDGHYEVVEIVEPYLDGYAVLRPYYERMAAMDRFNETSIEDVVETVAQHEVVHVEPCPECGYSVLWCDTCLHYFHNFGGTCGVHRYEHVEYMKIRRS